MEDVKEMFTIGRGKGKFVSSMNCLDKKADVTMRRGYLPHWEQEGKLQYVTFRLADSLPAHKIEQLRQASEEETAEKWLDQGRGECLLKRPEVRKIVVETLDYYDGKKYDLFDYVIMPNHVHLLMIPYDDLAGAMHSIKSFSAHAINKFLGRKGKVWEKESFDRIVRSMQDYSLKVEYILRNPEVLSQG